MVRIIDASVAIKWFVDESGREAALKVFSELIDDPRHFAVPELFYFELVNVFYRIYPAPDSSQFELLKAVLGIGMTRFSMTPDLSVAIFKFMSLGLSGYDAAYLALAEMTAGTWLTCDKKAHQKVQHLKLSRLVA